MTQNILGLTTPVKGFSKGNCPTSERKPRSSAQKRLDRTLQRHGQMILRHESCVHRHDSCVHRHESCVLRHEGCALRHQSCVKGKATHSRKGALTTARPLLVNACLTGETCAKHFADICYTASGSRAESQLHPTKRNIKAE